MSTGRLNIGALLDGIGHVRDGETGKILWRLCGKTEMHRDENICQSCERSSNKATRSCFASKLVPEDCEYLTEQTVVQNEHD